MNLTDTMLDYMDKHGPTPSAVLAHVAGLPDSGRVTALLKTRIHSGQVERVENGWAINPEWDEMMKSELRDARIILERAGYRVERPKRLGESA
jgi:hypothetical protein